MNKDTRVYIRVSDLEKEGLERAAKIAGIGFSAWARQRLRSAAIKELQEVGEKAIFLKPVTILKKGKK